MHDSAIDPRELTVVARDLGLGRRELSIHGRLPLGWCENLSAHLTARGASVERLVVTSDAARTWDVEIGFLGGRDVDVRRGLVDPEPLDERLHHLCMDGGRVWSERDGSVGLELHGGDRRGLLAALLRRFAMHGLFPVRFDVKTHDDRVHDRFVMRGFSGATPSAGSAERLLRELVHSEWRLASPHRAV